MVTYWRSSAKPLQAQAWLADGTIERFGWGAEELAIMSASHEGLDFQAGLVRRMLADLGLSEKDLRCDATLKARHNCSGNHTGFLAACVRRLGPPSYQRPAHRRSSLPRGVRRADCLDGPVATAPRLRHRELRDPVSVAATYASAELLPDQRRDARAP
jgi:hypothetical protein